MTIFTASMQRVIWYCLVFYFSLTDIANSVQRNFGLFVYRYVIFGNKGFDGRFTFERIHNTIEQFYIYERAENHKAKETLFESFK